MRVFVGGGDRVFENTRKKQPAQYSIVLRIASEVSDITIVLGHAEHVLSEDTHYQSRGDCVSYKN